MPLSLTGYYHGSGKNTLVKFDIDKADTNTPFGPAIYLTRNRDVAQEYTGKDGTIYSVTLCGKLEYTINLNAILNDQTIEVQKILKNIFPDIKNFNKFEDVREIITIYFNDLKDLNETMLKNGIWMIYGKLHAIECDGKKDYGIQYAVLSSDNLDITEEA